MQSVLRLEIVPGLRRNEFAVRCLVDGVDVLKQTACIGMEPNRFFSAPPLAEPGLPRLVRIGRCECGEEGCDAVDVRVSREDDEILWHFFDGRPDFRFDAMQYDAELARAEASIPESPQRVAERDFSTRVPVEQLRERGLLFSRATWSGAGIVSVVVYPETGFYRRIAVDVPCDDDADRIVALLLDALDRNTS